MENQTKTNSKVLDKTILTIVGIIIVTVLIYIAMISGTSEKFDLAEQLSLGQKYLQDLNYEQAILTFSKIIEIEPMSVEAYKGLVQTYEAMGDIDNLISTLEKGVAMTGDIGLSEWLDELKSLYIVIDWVDSNVEIGVRNIINKPTGAIKRIDLLDITNLYIIGDQIFADDEIDENLTYSLGYDGTNYVSSYNIDDRSYGTVSYITTLEDFVHFSNLETLFIVFNNIQDIYPLNNLKNLKILSLNSNNIKDITPIANMINLESLSLNFNQISDITSLSNLTNLKKLDLSMNNVNNITPLVNLLNLNELYLLSNNISDITTLSNLSELVILDLFENSIIDLSSLIELDNLIYIDLGNNDIVDWSPIDHIKEVEGRPYN